MSSRRRIERLHEQLAADPRNVNLLSELGGEYQRMGELGRACDAYVRLADEFQNQGFFLKAVALLKQVQKLDERTEVHFKLADLHLKLQLTGEALTFFSLGIRGRGARELGAMPPTLQQFRELQPTDAALRLYLAHVLLWCEREVDARDELNAAAQALRSTHADLADAVGQLAASTRPNRELFEEVKRVRLELHRRTRIDALSLAVDFTVPN